MTKQTEALPAMPEIVPNENARAYLAATFVEDQAIRSMEIKYCRNYLEKKENEKTVPLWLWFGMFFSLGVTAGLLFYWNIMF